MKFIKKYPLFIFLLPVFFVLHGFTENYHFVPVKDALLLTALYLGASLVFLLLFHLFYKNWLKAAILGFIIMAFHFFFGSIQDALRHLFPGSFIARYIFILPAALALLIWVLIILKRRKGPPLLTVYYLNFLLLLLVVIDLVWLTSKMIGNSQDKEQLAKEFTPCNTCNRPDVYVIITDEYAGYNELKEIFQFDNSPFLNQLSGRGFHVIPNSSSNYNFTPYSIASTLNMDYLDLQRQGQQPLLPYTYETIQNNRLLRFLQYHQYRFYNYSFFDFTQQPTQTKETFLPSNTRLITSQTLLSRMEKEMRFHLITTLKSKKEIRKSLYFNKTNNEKLFQLALETAQQKAKEPKFVLTHLMLPHYPYYYDKNGREFPYETLPEGNQVNEQHYIEYLQYGNTKILELADHILKHSPSPPVIIIVGDHGFRHFTRPVDIKYHFSNLSAVFLPGKNYAAFTDSLTNVNLMRAVLNTTFHQQLPYLKDTSFIMENP